MFTKVKAALVSAVLVMLAALAGWVADFDWSSLGAWGPVTGTAIPVAIAYLVRETKGYGAGVPPAS